MQSHSARTTDDDFWNIIIYCRHDTLSSNLEDMMEKSNLMTDKLDSLKQEYYSMITKNDEATMRYTNVIADLTVSINFW